MPEPRHPQNKIGAPGIFVTGTDTGVGKTLVSTGLLAAALQLKIPAMGMKPVATGAAPGQISDDVAALIAVSPASGIDLALINPYCFSPPIAPHLAALAAGIPIKIATISHAFRALQELGYIIVVEGAGGVCVPLSDNTDMLDIPLALNLPVLLVVAMRLGCLNHAILSAKAIQERGLTCFGWIANQLDPDMLYYSQNVASLAAHLQKEFQIPLLSEIHFNTDYDTLAHQLKPFWAAGLSTQRATDSHR